MTDATDGRSPQEIAEEAARRWQAGIEQARAEGRERPRISRVKREDHPHWERRGWVFQLRVGAPVELRDEEGSSSTGTVRGVHPAPGDDPVLLVEMPGHGSWGLRRADGEAWPIGRDVHGVNVDEVDLPVLAWRVESDQPTGDPVPMLARTGRLGEDD